MRRWKEVALVNVALMMGMFISIFTAPRNTPLWLWVGMCIGIFVVMNYIFFGRQRQDGKKNTSSRAERTVIAILGLLILLLGVLFNRWHR